MLKKSIVLLSGGLDSSLNLALGVKKGHVMLALTFNYNQKAVSNELTASRKLSEHYRVPHKVIDLPWLGELSKSALTNPNLPIPSPDINNFEETTKSAKAVWVSNRNGLFVNIAACFAERLEFDSILVGFNAEEAQTFPDNSKSFIKALNKSFSFSTRNRVTVNSYTTNLNKREIVKRSLEENLPFDLIWPCYRAGDSICGECESCKRYMEAGGIRSKECK